ncbi:MAG: alpha/beta fold hydrolase [Acidobacteriota bacterium]|nr:alpha/beta fold hydrolase [Acidobacteriota bacterium]MDQ5836077.1 alpha/beta fold hydrolase [Acidobacteriota bacterium]
METIRDSSWPRDSGGRGDEGAHDEEGGHVPTQALTPPLEEVARVFRSKPFVPHTLFRNGHAQTVAAALRLLRRGELRVEESLYESRTVEVEPRARVLLKCRWQENRPDAPTLLLLHGLEGSSRSLYVLGTARKAFGAGFNVVCMNMRNCGDTEHLSETLYHSGMTGDIHRVLSEELSGREGLKEIYVAGFSMSGNMVLRLAGDYGDDAPPALAGVVAVSPSIELNGCAERLERRENALYRWSFMRSLRRRVRRKKRLHPSAYDTRGLWRVRTLRRFDDRVTAPHGGFRDAADYYARTSSLQVIARIRIPTLILHAADDPLIPAEPFRDPSISANPNVLLILTERGGHVGFIAAASTHEDRRWAENRVVEFCRRLRGQRPEVRGQ